ncbi:MAG: hypothetical protein IT443_07770 [Phycisphaeraceae bacterium]|nr:hypothetical protein [Phycisphaeraceae bacterium]
METPQNTSEITPVTAEPSTEQFWHFWLPTAAAGLLAVAGFVLLLGGPENDKTGLRLAMIIMASALVQVVGCGLSIAAIIRAYDRTALFTAIGTLVANTIALVLVVL